MALVQSNQNNQPLSDVFTQIVKRNYDLVIHVNQDRTPAFSKQAPQRDTKPKTKVKRPKA